jgi:hypothetical protein
MQNEQHGLKSDEVIGTVELWKVWSAGEWQSKKLIESRGFLDRKERKRVMEVMSRKYNLHFGHNYFFLIRLGEPPEKFIRPKAEYTNTTPYGVANDLRN